VDDSSSADEIPQWTHEACRSITPSTTVETPIATREQGRLIWICQLREPWSTLWPRLTRVG
jgi:hypothetical protein